MTPSDPSIGVRRTPWDPRNVETRRQCAEIDDARLQQGSGSPGYTARIALDRTAIDTENGSVDLGPGMAVTSEIKTGQRRIIDYGLSPLVRYRQEGLRER
jgi:hypothetical protein